MAITRAMHVLLIGRILPFPAIASVIDRRVAGISTDDWRLGYR
jgi:hypothetical protein